MDVHSSKGLGIVLRRSLAGDPIATSPLGSVTRLEGRSQCLDRTIGETVHASHSNRGREESARWRIHHASHLGASAYVRTFRLESLFDRGAHQIRDDISHRRILDEDDEFVAAESSDGRSLRSACGDDVCNVSKETVSHEVPEHRVREDEPIHVYADQGSGGWTLLF